MASKTAKKESEFHQFITVDPDNGETYETDTLAKAEEEAYDLAQQTDEDEECIPIYKLHAVVTAKHEVSTKLVSKQ